MPNVNSPDETSKRKNIKSWLKRQFTKQCSLPCNKITDYANVVLVIGFLWTFLYCIFGEEMLPTSDMFRLLILLLAAWIGGILVKLVCLPNLLGMLLAGIILRSVGFYDVSSSYANVEETLRNISLSIILIKAGLGLDGKALFRLKYTVIKLSMVPCVGEAAMAAVVAHYAMGFSLLWGFLLGFIMSPISPAVVVPMLLDLQEKGYGIDKGIATMVIASTSIDDIAAIAVIGILLSNIFSIEDDLLMDIFRGPLEAVLGLLFGFLLGALCVLLPHRQHKNAIAIRSALIGMGGIIAVLMTSELNFSGCGTLACITGAFVANIGWNLQKDGSTEDVDSFFSKVWMVAEPVLFGLIGSEIDVTTLDWKSLLMASEVILGALVSRVIICWFALYGDGLNSKEKIFVILAWLPKATVQAALGPQALLLARRNSAGFDIEDQMKNIRSAELVLITAVLSIVITAPLGSIAINLTGAKLLTNNKPSAPA